MQCSFTTLICAALLFYMSVEVLSREMKQASSTHCFHTTVTKKGFFASDIIPILLNDSILDEPPTITHNMDVELCPNSDTLKLSWKINQTQDMKLCYKIRSALNEEVLHSSCLSLNINNPTRRSYMTCWFPMKYMSYRPVITALVSTRSGNIIEDFYGELNTNRLDSTNSCKDVCEMTVVNINSPVHCNDESSISYDDRITIKSLSFEANNSTLCNTPSVYITDQTSEKIFYFLNCSNEGAGYVKVFYSILGRNCFKYQPVQVFCSPAYTATSFSTTKDPGVEDFSTFVIFGVICTVVITFLLIAINFVVQRLKHFLKIRRRANEPLPVRHGNECEPLQASNTKPREESVDSSSSIVDLTTQVQKAMKREYIKRVNSVSSDDQSQQSANSSSFRRHNVRKLHRCMTIALLERTESFYRKKILFFPCPFDTFSRDATSLLKAVFTLELSIPTHCCFDRDVYQKYMTVHKNNWIDSILRDHDRIVIFLCFTTIHGEAKGRPIVEDVLEQLLTTKPRPQCKVSFLHLTDSSENFERNHHGDSFHVTDEVSYESFMSEMLNYCGRNPEAEPDMVYRLTKCETSRHFLRFIGIKTTH